MRGDILVSIAVLIALLWSTALVATAIGRWASFKATLGGILCLLLGVFCVYGFAASFEPGVELEWKLGYAALAGLFAVAAYFQSARVFSKRG